MKGIFNGKPTIPNLNRDERRKYIKEHKATGSLCPNCHNKTQKISDDNGNLFCELCGKII